MTPTTLTWISGVVLLLVFALVGWRLRRRKGRPFDPYARPFPPGCDRRTKNT
jgi:hypothetical protein